MPGMNFRIEGLFLRSKVARRVFLLFVLSAFIPAALLAWLAYSHTRSMEDAYGRRQLAQEGANYVRGLYDRLRGAHFNLGLQAAAVRSGIPLAANSRSDVQAMFTRIYRVHEQSVTLLSGPPSAAAPPPVEPRLTAHLLRGESALLVDAGAQPARVLLAEAVDPAQVERGVLVGELVPDYLWGEADDFSDLRPVCVKDGKDQLLFCSSQEARAQVAALQDQAGGDGAWSQEVRPLFLRARFAADDWSIVALRSPDAGDGGREELGYQLLAVILLALLLVALLSVVQIRRTLVPLERLIEGTRRIGREEFSRPVEVQRDDEFGELAQALNKMAARLGRQIGTLRALSEIDQEILERVDTVQIIERVQERLQDIWPRAVTSMVVFDHLAADFGIVHLNAGHDGVTAKIPTKLEPWLMERLARDYDGLWFDVGGADLPDFLSMMAGAGAQRILVLPIYWHDKINGLLAIGLLEVRDFNDEMVREARNLGNRIGVALAAHARDEELKYRAYHDSLTGLPNRALLLERLGQEMAHARRSSLQLAVLFMDLDRFKNINDSLGHECGDRLLCQVADRLASCTREGDTVARLGGDEFVVLLPGLGNPEQAARLAREMLSLLSEPFILDGSESYVGASIGVAIFPDDGSLPSELLKKADIAMYRAKAMGRGRVTFFEESMNQVQQERARLERELRQALERRQLSLEYQPRLRLADDALAGAEALLRWHHPELGWISPEHFIPLAEEIGLMDSLGGWVLQEVCDQLAQWQAAGHDINVSVNISARQLKSGGLVQQVRHALQSSGVKPGSLELEVTEGTLIENIEEVGEQLERIKQTGVTIALDDFGTGYSSLTYLQRLPLDILKIDRSFVQALGRESTAGSIVYSIVALAHALGKIVVAEGVERDDQLTQLRAWGCEQIQGNYYSRPLTAGELEELLTPSRPAEIH